MNILDDIMAGEVLDGSSAEQELLALVFGIETIRQILQLNSDPLIAQCKEDVKVEPLVGQRFRLQANPDPRLALMHEPSQVVLKVRLTVEDRPSRSKIEHRASEAERSNQMHARRLAVVRKSTV